MSDDNNIFNMRNILKYVDCVQCIICELCDEINLSEARNNCQGQSVCLSNTKFYTGIWKLGTNHRPTVREKRSDRGRELDQGSHARLS